MTIYDNDYKSVHRDLPLVRGLPSEFKCVVDDCDSWAYDWAWIHGTDPNCVNNYNPMCRSCHGWYDQSRLSFEKFPEICELFGIFGSRTVAKMFGVDKNTIKRIWRREGLIP